VTDQPMPAWEKELLHSSPAMDLKRAEDRYADAVEEMKALIQSHIDDRFSMPIQFRQNLMRQTALIRAREGQVSDLREAMNPIVKRFV
jgi:hypothetical protein